jgi:hypothetical protein
MKRLVPLLAVLLLAAVLSACGGSSRPAAAPTTTAAAAPSLAARAGAICRAYHRTLDQYNQPQTLPGIAVYYVVVQKALTRMVTQLSAIEPQTPALKRFTAATRAELKPVGDMLAAAKAGSVKRIRKVAIRGALLDKRAHALAVEAKLGACAETPGSSG